MKASVRFEVLDGEATIHMDEGSSRAKHLGPTTVSAGHSVTCPVVNAPEINADMDLATFAAAMANHAEAAPSAGGNKGRVKATAVGATLLVRQYLQTDAFLDPDAEQYMDHVLSDGRSVTADLITSNAVTLIVQDVVAA